MIDSTPSLLKKINVKNIELDLKHKKDLDDLGYCVFDNIPEIHSNLKKLNEEANKLIKQEGSLGGWEGKMQHYKPGKKFEDGADRLGALVDKSDVFRKLILIPELLLSAYYVVKEDIKLCGFNLRNPHKGRGEQNIHIDGFARKNLNDPFAGIVAFLYLDDSNLDNGAMRIIPGTHNKIGYPDDHIDITKKNVNEKRLIVKAGTLVVANLNLWHAGAKNLNGKSRKVIMINIKKRSYDQLLNYKKFLSKNVKDKLTEEQKYILAVRDVDKDQLVDSGGSANDQRRQYLESIKSI